MEMVYGGESTVKHQRLRLFKKMFRGEVPQSFVCLKRVFESDVEREAKIIQTVTIRMSR